MSSDNPSTSLSQSRLREERAAADENSLKLSTTEQARWDACQSSHRFLAFKDKQIVAYRLMFLRPEIHDIFTCKGLDVSLASGLSSLWESQTSGEQFWVSATPKEVAPNCFFWMLKYSSLELSSYKGQKSLKFSTAYQTLHNPKVKVDGTYYLLEKSVFDHFDFENN